MIDTLLHHSAFAGIGSLLIFGPLQLVVLVVCCVIGGYPIYVLGQRASHANPWFGFVPILQMLLLVELAQLEMFWAILCIFFPICSIYPWYKIAEKQGKNPAVAFAMLICCLAPFIPYYIVFG